MITTAMSWLQRRRDSAARVRDTCGSQFADTPVVRVEGERQTGKTEMVLGRAIRHAQEGEQVVYCSGTMRTNENTFLRAVDLNPLSLEFVCRANGNLHLRFEGGGALHFKAATAGNFTDRWDVAVFDDAAPVPAGRRVKLIYRIVCIK